MIINYENNNTILSELESFALIDIFDCGQCFRWNRQEDGSYIGIAKNRVLKISEFENSFILHDTSREDFENIWYDYFDLNRNYTNIRTLLSEDANLTDAFHFGSGVRILRQSLWECVVSFIISASNNIPRIKKIVELLCENFGDEIEYMGRIYYTFPSPERISALSLDELQVIRSGFRDKYILDAANKFISDSRFSEEYLKNIPTKDAKDVLMSIKGVGSKVADCVLLFGLGKYDSFPVDVWMKRIMEYLYFNQTEQSIKVISEFAQAHFGELGGFAQQYLFFYARENKIGL
ncbi:MAG: DNA-3-methyladenine glycosylase 2 family protein [Clostridia bacterium]|nr:DNA-3-methyladenine glycosylase 2 family protein [Clostridia bacterium]